MWNWLMEKQLQNTQALIDSANISTATWLYNIVLSENQASLIIETWDSILASRNSKHWSFKTRGSSLEFRAASVNFFWAVLYSLRVEVSYFRCCSLLFLRETNETCVENVSNQARCVLTHVPLQQAIKK